MAIESGQQLLHYRLIEKIGEGGMGVVWKALDTKLDREVAIKLLPALEGVAADERLARFEREAKLLASLNHPGIAGLYGLHEADGAHFLAMELVPGEDLAERLDRGPFPVEQALKIARQICEALEAAHAAKAFENEPQAAAASPSISPTVTSAGTTPGMILGTAAYMSPEQARGHSADKRSDVWAFGCTLYEMVTGIQPFRGSTVSDTLAAVLKTEPDWRTLEGRVPGRILNLLRRCLRKDARQRLHDVADARIVIEEVLDDGLDPADEAVPLAPSRIRERLAWVGLLAVGIVVAAVLGAGRASTPTPAHRKITLGIEDYERRWERAPVISPDGRHIAYASDDRLWIQGFDRVEPRVVEASQGAKNPFWSPDSRWIGFLSAGELRKAPVTGGAPTPICALLTDLAGATWGEEDTIVLAQGAGPPVSVSARGGEPTTLFELDLEQELDIHTPHFLPDGSGLVFAVHRVVGLDTLGAVDPDGQRKVLLTVEGAKLDFPVYSKATGHLLWHRRNSNQGIWAAPFSLRRLELTGEPFLVVPDGNWPSVSDHGHLVFVNGDTRPTQQLSLFDMKGNELQRLGEPLDGVIMKDPEVSPNGKQIAVEENDGENRDIWIHDVDRGTRTRFTFSGKRDCIASWSPDGGTLYWTSMDGAHGASIFRGPVDGTDDPVKLTTGLGARVAPGGASLVFRRFDRHTRFDLWTLALDSEAAEPRPLLEEPWHQGYFEVSPNGHFLAYENNDTGVFQVHLMRFPAGRGNWQVTTEGGRFPRWTPDGTRLLYMKDESFWEVRIDTTSGSPSMSRPSHLFDAADVATAGVRNFDIMPDGKLLVVRDVGEGPGNPPVY